jgi:hypothetical protein
MRLHRSAFLNGLAAAVILLSAAIYINSTVFSIAGSRQIDFSINYTAGRVLREGGDIYDRSTLRAMAERSGTVTIPTVYQEIFATYIQPPTTAFVTYFFAAFEYRTARLLWLGFNQFLLFAAFALVFFTLRREWRTPLYFAACAAVLANFGPLYMSLSLGQVDGLVVFFLALAIWAWQRGLLLLVGAAIAMAAAFKVVPGLLVLYFVWQRAYRVLAGAILAGVVVLGTTLAVLGPVQVIDYVRDVVPLLLKGSVHHQNVTISAFINRFFLDREWLASLSEIPNNGLARGLTLAASLAFVAIVAFATRPRAKSGQQYVREMALVVAAAILLSSIAWEFYLTWLLPVVLLLLNPACYPQTGAARAAYLASLSLALLAMSFPIGFLTEPNSHFYHPRWSPGVLLEADYLRLYASIDRQVYIPLLRISGLLLFCATLVVQRLYEREPDASLAGPSQTEGAHTGPGARKVAPEVVSPYHSPKDQLKGIS